MKTKKYSYVISAAALALAGWAGSSASASDFDNIVSSLLAGDRQLELSRAQAAAESDALKASNALADPEAEFEFLDGSGDRKYNLSVSQSFDWPGVYGARNRQTGLEQAGLQLANAVETDEQRLKLRILLIDIIAANRTIDQMSSAVEGCNKLLATLEAEYSRGNVSILEVNKVRVELADFKLQLSDALTNKEALTGELLAATGAAGELRSQCDVIDRFPLVELKSLDYYVSEAKTKSPAMLLAKNSTLVAKARQDVASKSTLPGFSAGYRLSHEDGTLFNGFTFGVSLPVWRTSKERKAAASASVSAMLGEEVEEIKLVNGIEAAYGKACRLKEALSQYGSALTASDNTGLLERAYNSGAITLTELVLDVNYFVEANVRYIELQRQYYNALAELSRYDDNLGD